MNENRKRGTSNNKILTAIAIASLFIGSSKIMAIETYSENSFGVTEQMQAQTARGIIVDQNGEPIIGASILEKGTTNGVTPEEVPPWSFPTSAIRRRKPKQMPT